MARRAGSGTAALATSSGLGHAAQVTVVPLPPRGEWFPDARDGERALRVSWHAELGCVVLSTWRDEACVGTVRLEPADAARLVSTLALGVEAALATPDPGRLRSDVESA